MELQMEIRDTGEDRGSHLLSLCITLQNTFFHPEVSRYVNLIAQIGWDLLGNSTPCQLCEINTCILCSVPSCG